MVALVVALVSVPVAAGAQDTNDRIASTRAAIDDAASRWFDSKEEVREARCATSPSSNSKSSTRSNVPPRLPPRHRPRALAIYKGSGTDLGPVFASDDALDSVRRAELLDRANADSERVIEEFEHRVGRRSRTRVRRSKSGSPSRRRSSRSSPTSRRTSNVNSQSCRRRPNAKRPLPRQPRPRPRRNAPGRSRRPQRPELQLRRSPRVRKHPRRPRRKPRPRNRRSRRRSRSTPRHHRPRAAGPIHTTTTRGWCARAPVRAAATTAS